MKKTVGVLLSGCGNFDGAEIRESVFTLLAIDQLGFKSICLAPNIPQHHVIDYLTRKEMHPSRNVLQEAARIARGQIESLDQFDSSKINALLIPGGQGVGKNLSNFSSQGNAAKIHPQIEKLITDIHKQNKPIGAICLSPALIGLLLGKQKVKLTLGANSETSRQIEAIGAIHVECKANEICIDEKLKIVSTPAYMVSDANLTDIYQGIYACVKAVTERIML